MLSIALTHSKFILSGEHFVVDGTPSVVIPASCFTTQVGIRDKESAGLSVCCKMECEQTIPAETVKEYESLITELIYRTAELLQIELNGAGLFVQVKSSIPPGQGAGSSSALSLAIVKAMIKHYFADDFHPNYLQWFGTELENNWHGPVSGIDNAAIAFRKILKFQRNEEPEILTLPCPCFFVVGSTGPRDTVNPYIKLKELRENAPLQYADCRRQTIENANKLAIAIERGDLIKMGECMNESHEMYKKIGIVTDAMQRAVQAANELGAFGARMTGAGGGGFVIACMPVKRTEALVSKWREMGLKCIRNIQFGLSSLY